MKRHLQCLLLICALTLLSAGCTSGAVSAPAASSSAAEATSEEIQVPEVTVEVPSAHPYAVPDSYTILIYLIGSNLETYGGQASADLMEIMDASLDGDVRVIAECGGAHDWALPEIDATKSERFVIQGGRLARVSSAERHRMSDENALGDFIRWAREAYPSEHYALILWDHGGGTLAGYGMDEYYPQDLMTIGELRDALAIGGQRFDFIGFDACLMATVETAMAVRGYADYLIASEEVEPGTGWYYTNWLKALNEDPGMDTVDLGRMIVDEFVYGDDISPWNTDVCLSVIDVDRVPALCESLQQYHGGSRTLMDEEYVTIARARAMTKDFGYSGYEQVDVQDYVRRIDSDLINTEEVMSQAASCVAYTQSKTPRAHGIAMYFPYVFPEEYGRIVSMMTALGYDHRYFTFFDGFMSRIVHEQRVTAGTDQAASSRTVSSDFAWYDEEAARQAEDAGSVSAFSSARCRVETDGAAATLLIDEDAELLSRVRGEVFVQTADGEEVRLGTDIRYHAPGELDVTSLTGAWPCFEGTPLSYDLVYTSMQDAEYEGDWYAIGTVPGRVDGDPATFLVYWGKELADTQAADGAYQEAGSAFYGLVAGYVPAESAALMSGADTDMVSVIRGMIPLTEGMALSFDAPGGAAECVVGADGTVRLFYGALDGAYAPSRVRFLLYDINRTEFVIE